jgi:hypothetical protein
MGHTSLNTPKNVLGRVADLTFRPQSPLASMSAAANEGRMLPNELIDQIFTYYSLLSNDRDDGFHRGPDRATENLSLKLLSLGRTVFFYARVRHIHHTFGSNRS